MRETISFSTSSRQCLIGEIHKALPPELAAAISATDLASEDVIVETSSIVDTIAAASTAGEFVSVTPFRDGYLVKGYTRKIGEALEARGYTLQVAGSVVLAKTQKKKKKKAAKSAVAGNDAGTELHHLASPVNNRLLGTIFKRCVEAPDFKHFPAFARQLDTLIDQYRVKYGYPSGHSEGKEESSNPDYVDDDSDEMRASADQGELPVTPQEDLEDLPEVCFFSAPGDLGGIEIVLV